MSDSVLLEIAKQIPFAVILFAVIVVFLNHLQKEAAAVRTHDKEMETLRIQAAKEREAERRLHESEMSNFWAITIKNMNDQQTQALQAIAKMISEHEESDKTRYENMHITKDLLEVAKKTLEKR